VQYFSVNKSIARMNQKDESADAKARQSLLRMLQEQYDITLEYCNALTSLHNLVTTNDNNVQEGYAASRHLGGSIDKDLHAALENVMKQVSLVQNHRQRLEQVLHLPTHPINNALPSTQPDQDLLAAQLLHSTHLYQTWKQHVERTQRILATLHHVSGSRYAANGIPLAWSSTSSTSVDTQTLALSTLRASVEQVQHEIQILRMPTTDP